MTLPLPTGPTRLAVAALIVWAIAPFTLGELLGEALDPTDDPPAGTSRLDWLIDTGPDVLVVTDGAGLSSVPFPLNPRPGVFGLDVFAQLAVLEPQASRGFAFSVPIRLFVGN